MTQKITDQAVRYFLGELSEAERNEVETRFFADADYSRFLDAAENTLIDDYVGGKLDYRRTQNFERSFLISERRCEKVRAAQILQTEILIEKDEAAFAPAPSVSLWRQFENLFHIPNLVWASSLAAIAILITLGGSRLANLPEENQTARLEYEKPTTVESSKLSLPPILPPTNDKLQGSNTLQKQVASRQNLKLAANLNLERREKPLIAPRLKSTKPIPALTLLPPMQGAEKPLIVGAARAIENIRLRVIHHNAENFVKYLVAIRASDGDLIWSREIAVSQKTLQKPIALDVRSGALNSGSYGLTISGATDDGQLEEINNYNFTVQKK